MNSAMGIKVDRNIPILREKQLMLTKTQVTEFVVNDTFQSKNYKSHPILFRNGTQKDTASEWSCPLALNRLCNKYSAEKHTH